MGQYYYAVAALPALFFDSEYYPTTDEFLSMCKAHLSSRDLGVVERTKAVIDDLFADDEGNIPALLESWLVWNRSLEADLAQLRAQDLGIDAEVYQDYPRIVGTSETAREIYTQDSPLAAEELLERKRWEYLDELEVGHYFDVQVLVVYLTRISILERRALFSLERGTESFSNIYNSATEGKIGEIQGYSV